MITGKYVWGFVVALVAASACSEASAPSPAGAPSVRQEVSPSGGQVALPGGQSVDVPAGALDSSTTITVAEADPAALQPEPEQIDLVAKPVVFTPHGLTFKVPVTLTIPYASASTDLVVLRLDDERDTTWEVVPATFEGGKARVQTTRFSVYAVAQRLDAGASCTELCSRLGACAADCARRCPAARPACLPSAWGQVVSCLASSSAPDAGACGPVTQFADDFARADAASLGGCWLGYPSFVPAPVLDGQRACGDAQSLAVMPVSTAPTTIAYDWAASDASGLETYAIVAEQPTGGSPAGFLAGVDGGNSSPQLYIKSLAGAVIAGPVALTLAKDTTYRLTASFDPSGPITVTVAEGATTRGTLSGNVGRAFTFERAGFIVGRNADAKLTCVDAFTLTNTAAPVCAGVASCFASAACSAPSGGADGGVDAAAPRDASPSDASSSVDARADSAADAGTDAAATSIDAGTDGGACGPVSRFTDAFARADAANLGGCWLTYTAFAPSPELKGQRACGDVQSLAAVAVAAARTTITYDWSGADASGLETNAIVLQDSGSGSPTGFFAGIDGGANPPQLVIKSLARTVVAGPVNLTLTPNTTYRLAATFDPSGAISVTVSSGATILGTVSGNAGGAFTFNRAGFIVGRNADANLTCVDDVAITQ